MMRFGVVGALAITVLAAQGPRTASAKRKAVVSRAAPSRVQPRPVPLPSPRLHVAPPPRRNDNTSTATTTTPSATEDSGQAANTDTAASASGGGEPSGAAASPKTAKTKVYTFGAMDVEGKLKTPQLLYFLNRVKLELEMSAPDHRSFMKELEKTAEDSNL